MNKIAFLLIMLVAFSALAQGDKAGGNVTFSKHSSALQLASYDEQTHTHKFRGKIRLTGTLFLIFDMEAPDRANGEINFNKFVPDPESAALLPAVVQGFYPGTVQYVNLNVSLDQVEPLFEKVNKHLLAYRMARHPRSVRRAEVVLDMVIPLPWSVIHEPTGATHVSVAPLLETSQLAAAKQVFCRMAC